MSSFYDYIITGGGASALMLAARLDLNALHGSGRGSGRSPRGLILEKTERPGTKLLMSGGGRCNITRGGSVKDFVKAYGAAGPRLRKCLYRHNNIEFAEWLEDNGISLADEKGGEVHSWDLSGTGRIFPASMKASDILRLLIGKAGSNGWEIRKGAQVYGLTRDEETGSWTVKASPAETFSARAVVIASGGITFPETGSDGSMFDIIRELGIEVTELRSALAPVYVEGYPYESLSGISIRDVSVTVFSPSPGEGHAGGSTGGYRKTAAMTGDLLFTHRGFSGPVILNISRYAVPGSVLRIRYGNHPDDLPKRLVRILEDRSRGPSGDIRTGTFAALLDSDDFKVTNIDENGMVTAGGISLDEIDTATMQLRRYPGLYAVGEVIDADGITGGYNLQMCWSTASAAAGSLAAL